MGDQALAVGSGVHVVSTGRWQAIALGVELLRFRLRCDDAAAAISASIAVAKEREGCGEFLSLDGGVFLACRVARSPLPQSGGLSNRVPSE